MQHHLTQLENLHAELLAALDGGDVEQINALVGRRAETVAALREDFEAATDSDRAAIQPGLAALLPLDRDLQSRAGTLRDHLQGELDHQRDAGGRTARPTTVTGIFDRQA